MVAPDDRREKVNYEINRPTFARLKPPLPKICRFIPYSELLKEIEQIGSRIRYMKPESSRRSQKAASRITPEAGSCNSRPGPSITPATRSVPDRAIPPVGTRALPSQSELRLDDTAAWRLVCTIRSKSMCLIEEEFDVFLIAEARSGY